MRTAPDVPADSPELVLVARMRQRIRLLRALRGAFELTLYGLAFAVVALLATKLAVLPEARGRALLLAALAFPVVGAVVSALRPIDPLVAAQLLDARYRLHDSLASALQFRALPDDQRTPMMAASIAAAGERILQGDLDPRGALRWRWPGESGVALALLTLLGGVAAVEFREARVVASAPGAARGPLDPLLLDDDDLRAFREFARDVEQRATTDSARQALHRFERFVDDIERQRLDRREAFRRLADLQAALMQGREEDREALRQALRELGERMDTRSELARTIAEALRQSDPAAARDAMRQLAERLRHERNMTQQQRQDLARALERAAQRNRDEVQEQLRRAREEVEQLLRRQRERQLTQNEQSLLHRRQREVERLQRESDRNEQRRRQVEHLQRELAQAAQDLLRDLQDAARDLEQGAEDLSRMQDEQQGQQSLEELRQRLEELRQLMRQQNGQNGQRQRLRLARFSRAAGGSQGGSQGQGNGNQPGGERQLLLTRGGGGIPLPMPGAGTGPPSGTGGQGPQGDRPGGSQAGTGHDENLRGAALGNQNPTQVVQVQGQHAGAGPSRSQVIRTSSMEGFAGAPYRTVFNPYWDHAREVLHQGEVPPGYRAYVRRYFQLIRPRDP